VLKGFKDFVLRGNVVDLAVAVVVGAAFTAIVTTFTKSLIEPLINAVTPPASPGLGIQLVHGLMDTVVYARQHGSNHLVMTRAAVRKPRRA